jgi:hypothetical protein
MLTLKITLSTIGPFWAGPLRPAVPPPLEDPPQAVKAHKSNADRTARDIRKKFFFILKVLLTLMN